MNGSTFEDRFARNWKWSWDYFQRKTKEFKIEGWNLALNRTKTKLGVTDYNAKTVYLSKYFLRGPTCGEAEMRNVILHELAHVLAGHQCGHGPEWKRIALKIGCNGDRCGHMDPPDAKYVVYCPAGCQKTSANRKSKNADRMLCAKCLKNPLIWKKLY